VVDPIQLASDIVQADAFLLLAPALWLFLVLFAWEEPELARRTGFGRTSFWLLLPGAILGGLANLPFFEWEGAILAVNIGGGLIPVVFGVLLFRRTFGDADRTTAMLLAALAAEAGMMFMAVLVLPAGAPSDLGVLLLGAVVPAILGFYSLEKVGLVRRSLQRTTGFLAIASGVLVATYASTATVPSLGIVSEFPYYLIGPVAAGAVSVLLAGRWFGLPLYSGLPVAYAASTIGVLFGADLLRQPPLYGNGAAIYAIGGAGVTDLVYLSGLLALVAGYLTYRFSGPHALPGPASPTPDPSPTGRLRQALQAGLSGRPRECITTAQDATHAAARQAALLTGVTRRGTPSTPWAGLPVPSWVIADQKNLDSLALSGTREPRDAFRAWLTARWLVGAGRDLGRERLGQLGARIWAFLADGLLLAVPSVLAWIYLSKTLPGSVSSILTTPLFNAAAIALPAYGFVYFSTLEGRWGTTLGKSLFGLRVTDRKLGHPGLVNVMVRNLPKLIPLTVVGLGGSLFVLTVLRGAGGALGTGAGFADGSALILLGAFIAVGVGVAGVASVLSIQSSSEGQRVGDFFAGTWVVGAPATSRPSATAASDGAAAPSG
jgi:uncharacterized membrane protein/uncharacterized RDD family membrane protein YckC